MKLWQKTSLICIAVLLFIVSACSAVLLIHSKNSILELTYSYARDRQKSLASSFRKWRVIILRRTIRGRWKTPSSTTASPALPIPHPY